MNIQVTFILVLSIIGFITSALSGYFVGNRVTHIIFVSTLGTASFAGLGYAIYRIIEQKVPELIDFIRDYSSFEGGGAEGGYAAEGDGVSTPGGFEDSYTASMDKIPESVPSGRKTDKFGDHLIIDNIEIKNEPKLMAEAIRTMLAKDED